jgi:two-component system, OmpR family, catabolic regulation response regulator CreB
VTVILVAERDPGVCNLLTDVLETELAAVVRCASGGMLAAKAIETGAFDLAIIDVGMPEISGYELARRAANQNIPALLCTGHPDALINLKNSGCPHLAKPFQIQELVHQAAEIITRPAENISLVKASLAQLQATAADLQADLAESRQLANENKFLHSRHCEDTA